VEVLLSRSDENRARSEIMQLELELLDTRVRLNTLLGRPVNTGFTAADTIMLTFEPSLDELKKSALAGNSSILLSRKNEEMAVQGVSEIRALSLPFVTLSGTYLFTDNRSQAGFVAVNRQSGFNAGLTARWTIFNGGRTHRAIRERNILALNQRYLTEQTMLEVDGQVYVSYQAFLLNRQIVDMELRNMRDSRQVQEISLERYRIGKAGLLETIETQKNFEDAQVRFINALYNAKLAEAGLLRVNGSLVK
jgi:outer membrane protein TolC